MPLVCEIEPDLISPVITGCRYLYFLLVNVRLNLGYINFFLANVGLKLRIRFKKNFVRRNLAIFILYFSEY